MFFFCVRILTATHIVHHETLYCYFYCLSLSCSLKRAYVLLVLCFWPHMNRMLPYAMHNIQPHIMIVVRGDEATIVNFPAIVCELLL